MPAGGLSFRIAPDCFRNPRLQIWIRRIAAQRAERITLIEFWIARLDRRRQSVHGLEQRERTFLPQPTNTDNRRGLLSKSRNQCQTNAGERTADATTHKTLQP